MGHEFPGGFDVTKGGLGLLQAHVAAGAEQGHVAHGFVAGGQDASEEWAPEDRGARDEVEGKVGKANGAGVIALVEGELGPDNGGANGDLLGDLVAGDGGAAADARIDPGIAIAVHDPAIGPQVEVLFCLREGGFPPLRLDVSSRLFDACR